MAVKRKADNYVQNRTKRMKQAGAFRRNTFISRARYVRPSYPMKLKQEEIKFVDNGVAFTTATLAGAITLLSGIAQGTDYNQRLGRQVNLKSCEFRIWFNAVGATTTNWFTHTRYILFIDRQSNATTPLVSEVLQSADYSAFKNVNTEDRFRILVDKTISSTQASNSTTISAVENTAVHKHHYITIGEKQYFSNTGSTVGSIDSGAIFALVITSNASSMSYAINARTRFFE